MNKIIVTFDYTDPTSASFVEVIENIGAGKAEIYTTCLNFFLFIKI